MVVASLILAALHRFLSRNQVSPPAIFALLLAMIFLIPLPQIVFNGMEHCLHILLVVLFLSRLQQVWQTKRGLLWLALLTALSTATRYDTVFLLLPVCLLFAARRRWQTTLALGFATVLPIALYGAISVHYGSLWLPNSIIMKAIVKQPLLAPDFLNMIYTRALGSPQIYVLLLSVAALLCARRIEKMPEEGRAGQFFSLLFLLTALLHLRFVPYYSLQWNCRYQAYLMTLGLLAFTLNLSEYLAARQNAPIESARDPKRALACAGLLFLLTGTLLVNLIVCFLLKEMNNYVLLFGPTVTAAALYFALLDPKAGKSAQRTTGIVLGVAGIYSLTAGLAAAFAQSDILQLPLALIGIAAAAFILFQAAQVADQPASRVPKLTGLAFRGAAFLSLPVMFYQGYKNIIYIAPASYNIYEFHIQMGRFLHRYYPTSGVIVNDIGVVTYMNDIHCLDVWGLGNVEVLKRYMKAQDTSAKGVGEMLVDPRYQIAILADNELGDATPPTWAGVGEWEISDDVVGAPPRFIFFATSAAAAPALDANLRAFAPNVPPTVKQFGPYTDEK